MGHHSSNDNCKTSARQLPVILQSSPYRIPTRGRPRESAGMSRDQDYGVRIGLSHARDLGACDLRLPIYRQERPRADRKFRKKWGSANQPVGRSMSSPGIFEGIPPFWSRLGMRDGQNRVERAAVQVDAPGRDAATGAWPSPIAPTTWKHLHEQPAGSTRPPRLTLVRR